MRSVYWYAAQDDVSSDYQCASASMHMVPALNGLEDEDGGRRTDDGPGGRRTI